MKELKIHVERIVRPILGSERRRNKMREELLGHMVTAYDEAVAQSETDPLAYAIERLGDPDKLRDELQAGISKFERASMCAPTPQHPLNSAQKLFIPSDVAPLKVAMGAWKLLFIKLYLFLIPALFVLEITSDWLCNGGINWPETMNQAGIVATFLPCVGLAQFSLFYLFRKCGLHKTMHVTSTAPALVKGCIAAAFCLSLQFLYFIVVIAAFEQSPLTIIHLLLEEYIARLSTKPLCYIVFTIIIFAVSIATFMCSKARRQYVKWGHLEIDE